MDRTKIIERHHRQLLVVLDSHSRTHPGVGVRLTAAGHEAIRALLGEAVDAGYVLGQLHADGIFPEGAEDEVAELEERLRITEIKAEMRAVADQDPVIQQLADLVQRGQAAQQVVDREVAKARHPSRNPETLGPYMDPADRKLESDLRAAGIPIHGPADDDPSDQSGRAAQGESVEYGHG